MVVYRYADATLPTAHGIVRTVVYRTGAKTSANSGPASLPEPLIVPAQDEHVAIIAGDVKDKERVLCRVHSECWTGETLGSLKCDCRAQLDAALEAISQAKQGVVVYLRQEGRGIGLGNKIRAYALQNEGKDTVEANQALGFDPDLRSYELAAAILRDLNVRSIALMTNNPDKLRELEQAGVLVTERVPHWVSESQHNQDYLAVKRTKLGHHT
jgi:GTP cyclohydrolase II